MLKTNEEYKENFPALRKVCHSSYFPFALALSYGSVGNHLHVQNAGKMIFYIKILIVELII